MNERLPAPLKTTIVLVRTNSLALFFGYTTIVFNLFVIFRKELSTQSLLIISPLLVVIMVLLLVLNKRLRPRVMISSSEILFRTGYLSRTLRIPWEDIVHIKFSSYQIDLMCGTDDHTIHYHSTPEISKAIKQTIRQVAETKQIIVEPG